MMVSLDEIRQIVGELLQLGSRADELAADTPLLGGVPEFDSMAVVSVLTSIEERYDIFVDDDEITAEVFENLGALQAFVELKLKA
jgi:acyl carrier protein